MLGHPPSNALAYFDAQIAERFLLASCCEGVVQFLSPFVQHEQGPELGTDGVLHVIKDGAQDSVTVQA